MSQLFRIALCALALLASPLASAQIFRAYLSINGNDANDCSLQAPCRLLPRALTVVANKGEVWMLDSANYNTGSVSIAKSVTIMAIPGVVGSLVAVNDSPAVLVGGGTFEISFRNLSFGRLATAPSTSAGIILSGASSLTIEDCVFQGLADAGVRVAAGTVRVAGTTFRRIENWGILVEGNASVSVHASRFLDNAGAIIVANTGADAAASLALSDSFVSGNDQGVRAQGGINATAQARLRVIRTAFDGNGTALRAVASSGALGQVSLASSSVTHNDAGFSISGSGVIQSAGDNVFLDNGASTGSLTPFTRQ